MSDAIYRVRLDSLSSSEMSKFFNFLDSNGFKRQSNFIYSVAVYVDTKNSTYDVAKINSSKDLVDFMAADIFISKMKYQFDNHIFTTLHDIQYELQISKEIGVPTFYDVYQLFNLANIPESDFKSYLYEIIDKDFQIWRLGESIHDQYYGDSILALPMESAKSILCGYHDVGDFPMMYIFAKLSAEKYGCDFANKLYNQILIERPDVNRAMHNSYKLGLANGLGNLINYEILDQSGLNTELAQFLPEFTEYWSKSVRLKEAQEKIDFCNQLSMFLQHLESYMFTIDNKKFNLMISTLALNGKQSLDDFCWELSMLLPGFLFNEFESILTSLYHARNHMEVFATHPWQTQNIVYYAILPIMKNALEAKNKALKINFAYSSKSHNDTFEQAMLTLTIQPQLVFTGHYL